MLQIALKSVWGRKRRLLGTFVAVFAGVAFMSRSLLLGDTLKANFDQLFEEANAGTDAVVRSAVEVESQSEFERAPIPASVLDRVRGAEGVAAAEPYVESYGQLIGKDGEGIGGNDRLGSRPAGYRRRNSTPTGSWKDEHRAGPARSS